MTRPPNTPSMGRRRVLASLAAGATALSSGCIRRLRTITGWQSSDQMTLEIKTVSADADPYALPIANQVAEWFRSAGIDTTVTLMSNEELLRQVLLNHEFDLFVARTPTWVRNPDALYSFLHSQFAPAPGWQNPFGYANLNVDELLKTQRNVNGAQRNDAVSQLQQMIATTQPFTAIGLVDDIRAVRSDQFTNWRDENLGTSLGYVALEREGDEESEESETKELGVVLNDTRLTRNLNPLSVEFRRSNDLTGLLYDSLGYMPERETVEPWLATSWEFSAQDGGPIASVRIPGDVTWHDGNPLTAEDIAFTYAFLSDTTLGSGIQEDAEKQNKNTEEDGEEGTTAVPAPRFQGRSSLVYEVRVIDRRTVEFRFIESRPQAARRAFTVPILPKHIWSNRTQLASVGGIEVGTATEALVTENVPPVGSGPLMFVENDPQRSVVFERFDDHFLTREDDSNLPAELASGLAFDRLLVRSVGSDVAAVEMIASGDVDVNGTAVGAELVPRIGRKSELDLVIDRSKSFYIAGYNVRQSPLANPRIRNTLAQLIDKQYIVEEVIDGYAEPAVSSLTGTDWLPSDLQWEDSDPVTPFLGTNGELDVERAREAFRSAGYQYNDGNLVGER